MVERVAACACGQLKVRCAADPVRVSVCHCTDCQRRTGSAFGVAAFFDRSDAVAEGRHRTFTRNSDSGYAISFHFCPDCGSTVFWEPSRKPDLIALAVGAFADPNFPAPSQAVYGRRRHPWVELAPPLDA